MDIIIAVSYRIFSLHLQTSVLQLFISLLIIHPQPLTTSDLFTVFIILPFVERHGAGITQYVAFSDWLHYFSHAFNNSVFSWFDSSFLYSAK